jgi:hypothetical protein
MITIEDYLNAKKITDQYESENKKKAGRPALSELNEKEKSNLCEVIFKNKKELNYIEIIYFISTHLKIGLTSSKKILSDLKKSNSIYQKEFRGDYLLTPSPNLNKY